MKKRILLIKASNPTKFNNLLTFPLGIMYLSACLMKERRDVDLRILDLRLEPARWRYRLKDILMDYKPDIIGISALTIELNSLKNVAEIAKRNNPETIVIAGGPHVSAYPLEVLEDRNIDYIVIGEGEITFLELINFLIEGGNRNKIKGIGFREDNGIKLNEPREFISNIDELPFPSYELVNVEKYFLRTSMSHYGIRRYANLYTSRSCPYRCIYCHNIFGKGFRGMSPERVVEEIKFLQKRFDLEEIEVVDDVFNFDIKRAIKIFEELSRSGLKLKYSFPNGLRGDRLEGDLIRIMKSAGTVMITIAVESASPRIQRVIKKYLDLQKTEIAIDECNKAGILTRGFFMLGFPEETEEEMRVTIDYACSSSLHIAMFYITIPFKGTELYEMVKEKLNEYDFSPQDYEYVSSRFNLSGVDYPQLIKLQAGAYRKFYSNPWRWWKILTLSPYKKDLLRYLPALGLRLLLDKIDDRRK